MNVNERFSVSAIASRDCGPRRPGCVTDVVEVDELQGFPLRFNDPDDASY